MRHNNAILVVLALSTIASVDANTMKSKEQVRKRGLYCEANIGTEKYGLSENDSIYFDSSTPHYFKNAGTGEARLICIIAPPIL